MENNRYGYVRAYFFNAVLKYSDCSVVKLQHTDKVIDYVMLWNDRQYFLYIWIADKLNTNLLVSQTIEKDMLTVNIGANSFNWVWRRVDDPLLIIFIATF